MGRSLRFRCWQGVAGAREEAGAYLLAFERILDDLGLSATERVVAAEPTFMMGQGFRRSDAGAEPVSEPIVHGVMVEARRVVDGIPVDGSRVKVLFRGPGEVLLGDVSWPAFVMHPSLDAGIAFKSREEIVTEIAARLGAASDPPEVRAGVVFRPVEEDGRTYFTPALQVVRIADGAAGEIFYVDLDASTPSSER